ncbi:TIGR03862 family flavoprotein [Halovulum sp. GXIMD14793]
MSNIPEIIVIGTGPAGLMAAEVISAAGHRVLLADKMPSPGRKFLMAGKSGLNLTYDTDHAGAQAAITPQSPHLRNALSAFGPSEVRQWAEGLGQSLFTGSSRRVFPKVMKASPLLRAWLERLNAQGVELKTRWAWQGWEGNECLFSTPEGIVATQPKALVLALGGASWSKLGSDGAWTAHLPSIPLHPANMGFEVDWSDHMARHFGAPVKQVRLSAGTTSLLGEFVISRNGLEGSVIYALSRELYGAMTDQGTTLTLDLLPDTDAAALAQKLAAPRGKTSATNHLRKRAGLSGAKAALLREGIGPTLPPPGELAHRIKNLPLRLTRPRPLDEAISTAGGLPFDTLDDHLMLQDRPGTFIAGEMLDWEAPTGGFLITTCLATGRLAAEGAIRWLRP